MKSAAKCLALAATLGLSACLYANSSLIPDDKSLKLFGDSARFTYLSATSLRDKPPLTYGGAVSWNGNGYDLTPDESSGQDKTKVKLATLEGTAFLIAEELDVHADGSPAKPSYALARRDGSTVRVYNSDCEKFGDDERRLLGLTKVEGEGGCRVDSLAQLGIVLKLLTTKPLDLNMTYTVK